MRITRNMAVFLAATAFLGVASGMFDTSSNNYYAEVFRMTAGQRGALELPREMPGFLVAVMAGALFFMAETHLAVLAASLLAAGLLGLGLFAQDAGRYALMLAFLVTWSAGTHLLMPVTGSLSLTLAEQQREGEKLGKVRSIGSMATVIGAGIVWLSFRFGLAGFSGIFVASAIAAAGAALLFVILAGGMGGAVRVSRPKLVFKRRYGLFYVLSTLFGARKQVFLTFGPWVLIRLFDQPTQTIAFLWMIAHLMVICFLPAVGRAIDRFGERRVMLADAIIMIFVCTAYGFAREVLPMRTALLVVCAAYVVDQFLFPVQIARSTYLSKIAESRDDIGGALGLGVSIDHAVSIPIAMTGGLVWAHFGPQYVFMGATGIAVLTAAACCFVRIPRIEHPELVEGTAQAFEDVRREFV